MPYLKSGGGIPGYLLEGKAPLPQVLLHDSQLEVSGSAIPHFPNNSQW
jgi:hypothetical protein